MAEKPYENRSWINLQIGGGGLLVVLVLLVAVGNRAAENKSLELERLVLKDKAGRVRAELAVQDDGSAGLTLKDREGRDRLEMSIAADELVGYRIFDKNHNQRFETGFYPDGEMRLDFEDGNGIQQISLKTDAEHDSALSFLNKNEKTRLTLGSDAHEVSGMNIYDVEGRRRLTAVVGGPQGGLGIEVYNERTERIINLGNKDRAHGLSLFDGQGKPRFGVGVFDEGQANLNFRDPEGKLIYVAPK